MIGNKELLVNILMKKAKGYAYREKTDEYVFSDGKKQLVKSKVVTKRVQPDVSAIKALIQLGDGLTDVTQLTDEQLQVEKLRLIKLLNEYETSATAQSAAAEESPPDG